MVAANVILVCGHECPDPGYLRSLDATWTVVAGGRALTEAIETVRAVSSDPVCVVPMTLGRDPGLIADAARALSWSRREPNSTPSAPLALSPPLGATDHLVGWLRGRAVAASTDALLVTAPTGGPFEDAELFRIARLVRQFGPAGLVEVALLGGDPDLDEGIERCRRLGADRITVLPAWLGACPPTVQDDVVDGGPLLGDAALRGVVAARVSETLHRLSHGHDGIDDGLDAEHGHGFAHSHEPGEGHGHGHGHRH
ncbi:sirohydrochlorin chelatase [Rhodococcus sp. ACT016]|uniref:sirohydrochlorin chelatase n=1 Tax=Rhodococcus sp. ACT016 TaxID=3134808 RepID=UPI003D267B5A